MEYLELQGSVIEYTGQNSLMLRQEAFEDKPQSYSISFWIRYPKVLPKSYQQNIVFRGPKADEFQPQILLQKKRVVCRFNCVHSSGQLISEYKLVPNEWVHYTFVCNSDVLTEVSLHVNGKHDTELALGSEIVPGKGNVYIGKNPWFEGVRAEISEVYWHFGALSEEMILDVFETTRDNFLEGNFHIQSARSFGKIERQTSSPQLLTTLIGDRRPPTFAPDPIPDDDHEHDHHQAAATARTLPELGQSPLERWLDKNDDSYRAWVSQLVDYFDWLAPLFIILRNALPKYMSDIGIQANKLEVDRMVFCLSQVGITMSASELVNLAKAVGAHEEVGYTAQNPAWNGKDEDSLIHYFRLLRACRNYLNIDFQREDEHTEDDFNQTSEEQQDYTEFESFFRIAEDFANNNGANFEVCIDFCRNCASHNTTFWHTEKEYADLFDMMLEKIAVAFPGADVIGNKYKTPKPGTFSMFLEGAGPSQKQDSYGRCFIYKKNRGENLPYPQIILDRLYALVFTYGDTNELMRFQDNHKRTTPPTVRSPECVTAALAIPEEIKRKFNKETGEEEFEPDTVMYCKNWACQEPKYLFGSNNSGSCRHHPGRWEFGSVHGLWPECWTCCRRNWDEEGCTVGQHRGVPFKAVPRLCVNRGEVNPMNNCPDSYCGKTFPLPASMGKRYEQDETECHTHSGYRRYLSHKSYVWTCCEEQGDVDDIDDTYCVEDKHRFAEWPDEEAKVYFITKRVTKFDEPQPNFSRMLHTSRFFNGDIQPYVNLDPQAKKKAQEALLQEPRYCINNACEQIFKEADNHGKACKSHPKYWDFGHSGQPGTGAELWPEQWRCCGKTWEHPGCTRRRHRGPLIAEMQPRPWKWPDPGAKRYFHLKLSKLWKEKLELEVLSPEQVKYKFNFACKQAHGTTLPITSLQSLAMALHLHILCVSDDMSYMYKYRDVMSGDAAKLLDNGRGEIEESMFLDWWFAPIEVVRPEMAMPKHFEESQ